MKNIELIKVTAGKTFKIGDMEFIKFSDENGITTAVSKDVLFHSRFGDDNNLANSDVLKKLEEEIVPKIADEIGMENICDITTDLTTLDGLKPYEPLTSKVSLPTLDFYRENVEIFDKYKVNNWWWLATPESAQPHSNPYWTVCVSPSGFIFNHCYYNFGVRPFWNFVSSIFVSCEE